MRVWHREEKQLWNVVEVSVCGVVVVVELPVCSPLVSSVHKILEQWETDLRDRLEKFDSAPANYIPGVYIEPSFGSSVTIVKYHTIMDPANTPFTWVFMRLLAFCFYKLYSYSGCYFSSVTCLVLVIILLCFPATQQCHWRHYVGLSVCCTLPSIHPFAWTDLVTTISH